MWSMAYFYAGILGWCKAQLGTNIIYSYEVILPKRDVFDLNAYMGAQPEHNS